MGSVAQDNQGNIALGFSASVRTIAARARRTRPVWPAFRRSSTPGDSRAIPAGPARAGRGDAPGGGGLAGRTRREPVGRLQRDERRSDRRVHVLVHERVLRDLELLELADADRELQVPGLHGRRRRPSSGHGDGLRVERAAGGRRRSRPPTGYLRETDASGTYSFSVAPGTYTITAQPPGLRAPRAGRHGRRRRHEDGGLLPRRRCRSCSPPEPPCARRSVRLRTARIDPGEQVTVNLCLANIGAAGTTNLDGNARRRPATSRARADRSPSAPSPPAAERSAVRSRFRAAGACGSSFVATLALNDGAADLGSVTFDFVLGAQRRAADGELRRRDGARAAGRVDRGERLGDVALEDRHDGSGLAPELRVRRRSDLGRRQAADEPGVRRRRAPPRRSRPSATASTSTRRFDGGVLEVSSPNINAGAFTDVTNAAVGGSFVSGGYSTTLETGFGNPLGGRPAWTGRFHPDT